jgi:ferritin-like metal-binding protein YciE
VDHTPESAIMTMDSLRDLFELELKDIYYAEKRS